MKYSIGVNAVIMGLLLLIVSIPVMGLLHNIYPENYSGCNYLPNKSKEKYYMTTILIGLITYFLGKYTGINKIYCT